ncbi:uncharacterized protein LAJ45_04475 [Morchella importuna]|uniref:uncharacterized protein n=1 Tax=Morchella importuna TaxID=1174673 RepID=UPI001E8CB5A4|nr:uncharacterized protein LAJ45_04475 [Morchella importuna]KAH8151273.1 hypothetical protein LAJ45_04475 [Morchella importuna]
MVKTPKRDTKNACSPQNDPDTTPIRRHALIETRHHGESKPGNIPTPISLHTKTLLGVVTESAHTNRSILAGTQVLVSKQGLTKDHRSGSLYNQLQNKHFFGPIHQRHLKIQSGSYPDLMRGPIAS